MKGESYMPNYRYQSPEYMNMRRGNCKRPSAPVQSSCQTPCEPVCQDTAPVCCNDKGSYDELRGMPLAMAYVPWQEWCDIYEADKGFCHGTIFKELNKPFRGIGGCCK